MCSSQMYNNHLFSEHFFAILHFMTFALSMASQAKIKRGYVGKYMHIEGIPKLAFFKTWNGMDRNVIE